MRLPKLILIIILCLFPLQEITSQWINDPAANLMICDLTGAQSLPKIASTSDGGCYISWFDQRSGDYRVYLQRLNALGVKQWDPNGLLISSNPQSSSLVDYDMICDASDNAVLIFSDTRNGGNLNEFAYKISPSGNFLWGNNGIDLYPISDFQPNGKIAQTDDGGYVFVWIVAGSPSKIAVQKISSDGNKLWGTNPILLQGSTGEGFNYPYVIKSDNNSVLLLHTATTGNFPAQTIKLRAQKLNSSGVKQWGTDGIYIQNLGRIAAFQVPNVISDGMNGAFMSWYDDRNNDNLQSAFIQRISSDSLLYYPVNGAEVSLAPARQKYSPVVSFDPAAENAYVFWMETEPNQNQNGIMGQKLSSAGSRLWGDNAKVFKDLSAPNTISISNVKTKIGNDRAYVFYFEGNAGGLSTKAEGFACNFNGDFVWPGSFVTLSNPTAEKLHLVVTSDVFKNCKLAWGDRRIDEGIYAQDINPSGQLGNPVTPVELISFTASVISNIIELNWMTASENNNKGFEIERRTANEKNNWKTIGFVNGKGTTNEISSYSYEDKLSFSERYFYRLKQLDYNGQFSYSDEVEASAGIINTYSLGQNYPNPFNPSTTITYSIPDEQFVTLKLYDCLGREVSIIVNEHKKSGIYKVSFNDPGLSSGIYYYRINAGKFSGTRSMMLIK